LVLQTLSYGLEGFLENKKADQLNRLRLSPEERSCAFKKREEINLLLDRSDADIYTDIDIPRSLRFRSCSLSIVLWFGFALVLEFLLLQVLLHTALRIWIRVLELGALHRKLWSRDLGGCNLGLYPVA
jgi:hypothetical protein